MSATIPSTEPKRFVAGDLVRWTIELPDYLPADGWTLHYTFIKDATAPITIDGTDNGDGTHLLTISLVTSATFAASRWGYQGYVTQGSPVTARSTQRTGNVLVDPAFAGQSSGYDARSWAQQMLDLAKAALVELATNRFPVDGYTFSSGDGSRSVSISNKAALNEFIREMERVVDDEERAADMAKGMGDSRHVGIRFRRV